MRRQAIEKFGFDRGQYVHAARFETRGGLTVKAA